MSKKISMLALACLILYPLASLAEGLVVKCGSVINEDAVLDRDLTCPKDGITIGKDGITMDLGGHTLTGPGRGAWVWPGRALSSVGVKVTGRQGVTVKNGKIKNFATGVLLERANQVKVQEVAASENHYGIYLYQSRLSEVSSVDVFANVYGLHLQGSSENRITGSRMHKNGHSPGGYGLTLYSSPKNVALGNTIEANQTVGIWIIDSRDNLIYRNNLVDNHPNAVDETGANTWYDVTSREGNFWSDYRGQASSGSLVGTSPHRLGGFGSAFDRYPFIRRDGWVKQ